MVFKSKKDKFAVMLLNISSNLKESSDYFADYKLKNISDLKIKYNGSTDTAEISGKAKTQADREKAIIAIGNVQNVAKVIDNIDIEEDAPESTMYTVKSGDSLSKIAKDVYGSANDYMKIFEANKPMLSEPDKIYPGQVLRIPKP